MIELTSLFSGLTNIFTVCQPGKSILNTEKKFVYSTLKFNIINMSVQFFCKVGVPIMDRFGFKVIIQKGKVIFFEFFLCFMKLHQCLIQYCNENKNWSWRRWMREEFENLTSLTYYGHTRHIMDTLAKNKQKWYL